ncbi:MAG: alanine racemase [Lachnospiraceae bacterium]|nr:alanine racemase [Lachnospiraceae bacterium]
MYARIDVDNLRHNIKSIMARHKKDMKVLAVIKADAYGHGSCEIARRIDDMAYYYGVAAIDEAVELRNAGVKKPILVIGYTSPEDYDRLIKYNITQTMYSCSDAKKLSELAVKNGTIAKIHIKVDTGMSRIGFPVSTDGINEAASLKELAGLHIEGIFTHYAKADEIDKSSAKEQKEKFKRFIDGLMASGIKPELKHIDNSAGSMELDDDEFDMVRLGIAMYGLYPSEEVSREIMLKPVMSLIAHIAHVKEVDAGCGVSYGWTYVTNKKTKLATVTAGYADGYPRAMSNIGRAIVKGRSVPIVGRVCMDQLMLDVTDIPDITTDDEVILIGKSEDENISVEEVAAPAASFNYELVCNISRRVPRIYIEEGREDKCVNYLV